MKVQNQKTSNYKDGIQKENFTGEKPEMTYLIEGKTLLIQKNKNNLTCIISVIFIYLKWIQNE